MRAETLRCLRDPDCKNHPIHAGHLQKLDPVDPRTLYESRQRRKELGKRAWGMIRMWQKYHGKTGLTKSERYMLFVFIRDALTTEHSFAH